jgi:hypothetical protein
VRLLGARVHFWPFDGRDVPAGRSAIAEVYPALWEGGAGDHHEAFASPLYFPDAPIKSKAEPRRMSPTMNPI